MEVKYDRENEWYIVRCACCDKKIKAIIKKNEIIPTTPQEAAQNMQKILNKETKYIKNAVVRKDGITIDFRWGNKKQGVCHLLDSRMKKIDYH